VETVEVRDDGVCFVLPCTPGRMRIRGKRANIVSSRALRGGGMVSSWEDAKDSHVAPLLLGITKYVASHVLVIGGGERSDVTAVAGAAGYIRQS
jgi:hypothetical protein